MNLIQNDRSPPHAVITMKLMTALLLVLTTNAVAGQDAAYCEMVGSLARGITADRDRNVSYNAELGKIKGATQDLPSRNGIFAISKSALKMAYLEMPKITPADAYKLYYVTCMSTSAQ
jgi:hypothetical protein